MPALISSFLYHFLKEWNFLSLYIVHVLVEGGKKRQKVLNLEKLWGDWQAISEKFQNLDVYAKF